MVPAAVTGPPEVVKPVVPPDTLTLVTVPTPPACELAPLANVPLFCECEY